MKNTKKELVNKFINILEEYGDIFFSTGSITKDYNYIQLVLKHQGYYSGVKLKYYLDNNFNLIRTEYRFR